MNKTSILYLVFIIFCFGACNLTTTNKAQPNDNINSQFDFLSDYKFIELPYYDSTNFDNHNPIKLLSSEQIHLLNLDKVYGQEYINFDGTKIGITCKLKLSEKFNTIVVYIYFNEQELSSTLINYDFDYNVIDYKMISMDEIAEGYLRSEAVISLDSIEVTDYKYFDPPIIEKNIYNVTESGKIIASR